MRKMKTILSIIFLSLGIMMSCNSPQVEDKSTGEFKMDRTILPIHPPETEPVTEMDVRNVELPRYLQNRSS